MKPERGKFINIEMVKYLKTCVTNNLKVPFEFICFTTQKQADKIAGAIATPLFNYDENTIASIITAMATDNGAVRAIELFDNTSESILFGVYKTGDNELHSGKSVPMTVFKFENLRFYEIELFPIYFVAVCQYLLSTIGGFN